MDLTLLDEDGTLRSIALSESAAFPRPTAPLRSRVVYHAAPGVTAMHRDTSRGAPAVTAWYPTCAFRCTMWWRGRGAAVAMDNTKRDMGLSPAATRELIPRAAGAAREVLDDPEIS